MCKVGDDFLDDQVVLMSEECAKLQVVQAASVERLGEPHVL